jgi:acetoin utilization deacetylase AcuC-like enzyme
MGIYLRHESSYGHETGAHPENARRLAAIEQAMSERDWMGLELVEAPAAGRAALLRVHTEAHVEAIEATAAAEQTMIDMDTIASRGSWQAALHAAGGAVAAVDRSLDDGGFAFCGLRPPGHHAEAGQAMGFCLFNNIAVAAAHAVEARGVERVLICDWDVHHGNGTEAIFYGSSAVLYASLHQSPLYPGTGAASDLGSGEGEGYTVNLPVPPGSGPDEFLALVQHVVAPIARAFRPGLLLLSAGYDAHRDDPLAQCELDEAAFRDMAASFRELGAELGAPLVACLEGGYNVTALADSVLATIEGLGGAEAPRAAPAAPVEPYLARLAPHWPLPG